MSEIQTPPFLLTYYNPFDKNNPSIGKSFLNYVKDVSLAGYTASLIGTYFKNVTTEQITAFNNECRFLDQRLARIQQGQINTNILLENIGTILRLPDNEKQRQLHIERGVRFSIQSLKDDDLGIDSKNELDSALKLMPQDWFVLQQLGMLLLYNERVINIPEAKECFLKAAKYANADLQTDGNRFINSLFKQKLSTPSQTETSEDDNLKDFVREAYLNAALASYILGEFDEAAGTAKKALAINPTDSKSLFLTAKYLARTNNNTDSLMHLKKACNYFPPLYIAAINDKDITSIPNVEDFYKSFLNEFNSKLKLIKERIEEINEYVTNADVLRLLNMSNDNTAIIDSGILLKKSLSKEYEDDRFFYDLVDYKSDSGEEKSFYEEYLDYARIIINKEFDKLYGLLKGHERLKSRFKERFIKMGFFIEQGYDPLVNSFEKFERLDEKYNFFTEIKPHTLREFTVKDLLFKWERIQNTIRESKIKEEGIIKASIIPGQEARKLQQEQLKKIESEKQERKNNIPVNSPYYLYRSNAIESNNQKDYDSALSNIKEALAIFRDDEELKKIRVSCIAAKASKNTGKYIMIGIALSFVWVFIILTTMQHTFNSLTPGEITISGALPLIIMFFTARRQEKNKIRDYEEYY